MSSSQAQRHLQAALESYAARLSAETRRGIHEVEERAVHLCSGIEEVLVGAYVTGQELARNSWQRARSRTATMAREHPERAVALAAISGVLLGAWLRTLQRTGRDRG